MPRSIRPDNRDACPLTDAVICKDSGEASDRVGGLAHAPLLARHGIDQGTAVGVPPRGGQECPRGRIIRNHEAEAAFAAIAA